MKAESHSSSRLLTDLLFGPARKGVLLTRHELKFGNYVLTLTPPRAPRMPNGIECKVTVNALARVAIGDGRLVIGSVDILPGQDWNPVPSFDYIPCLPAGPEPLIAAAVPWMAPDPGQRVALAAGYAAGLVLLHGQRKRAEQVAARAMAGADPLGMTLLRHAARGEVPEPVHLMLASREPGRLSGWPPYGIQWMRGLVSAGLPLDAMWGAPMKPAGARRRGIA